MNLTARQRECYDLIVDFQRRNGYSPSIKELQKAMHVSSASIVHGFLDCLEERGHIHRLTGKVRNITVVSGEKVAVSWLRARYREGWTLEDVLDSLNGATADGTGATETASASAASAPSGRP